MSYFGNMSEDQFQNAMMALMAAGGGMMANSQRGFGPAMGAGVAAGLNQYETGLKWSTRERERQEDREQQQIISQQEHARTLQRDFDKYQRDKALGKPLRDYYDARSEALQYAMDNDDKPKPMTELERIQTEAAALELKKAIRLDKEIIKRQKEKDAKKLADEIEDAKPNWFTRQWNSLTKSDDEAKAAVAKAIEDKGGTVGQAKALLQQDMRTSVPGNTTEYLTKSLGLIPEASTTMPGVDSPSSYIRGAMSGGGSTYQGGFFSDPEPGLPDSALIRLINSLR